MKLDRRSVIGASAALSLSSWFASVTHAQNSSDLEFQAARAAMTLSRFEATAQYGMLYQEMHLDCQALVPSSVVVGWYRDSFAPRNPGVITDISAVRMVSWNWAGNGKTYPETAEVSFVQSFGEDGPVSEKVRLVRQNGRWRWFFGRDVDFINQELAIYAPMYPPIFADPSTAVVTEANSPPWGIATMASSLPNPEAVVSALPTSFAGNVLRSRPITGPDLGPPPNADEGVVFQYTGQNDAAIPSAVFGLYRLANRVTASEAIERIKADGAARTPADRIMVDGNSARMGVHFLIVDQFTNDAVGRVPFLFWGSSTSRWLYAASAHELAGLRLLIQMMVENLSSIVLNSSAARERA